jgi:predicted RNA-binding protein with EMAP domain
LNTVSPDVGEMRSSRKHLVADKLYHSQVATLNFAHPEITPKAKNFLTYV